MAAKTDPEIYLEWDIVFKKFELKKERDKIVKNLLKGIKTNQEPKAGTVPLEYEVFKSETSKLSYILRVYKKEPIAAAPKANPSEENNSIAKSRTLSVEMSDEPEDPSADLSGPIRPNGPPKPPPPSIANITLRS